MSELYEALGVATAMQTKLQEEAGKLTLLTFELARAVEIPDAAARKDKCEPLIAQIEELCRARNLGFAK